MATTTKGIYYPDNYSAVADIPADMQDLAESVDTALDGYQEKVSGKGLSTNDFTNADKEKLEGIEAEANKTIVDNALSSSSTNPVQNKKVYEALGTKVDKVTGKGLSTNDYTDEEKAQVATNTSDISDIKAEQITQNNEIEALQERDELIISQIPTEDVSGESVDITDSSDLEFKKFEVEGNSVQGENPSPSYPQTIYSAGDNGSITEIIAGKNHFNINGTYSKSNCNYSVSGNSLTLTGTYTYGNVVQEISNLKGNEQYRLHFEGDNAPWIRIQDGSGTVIGETYNVKGITFTTPANGTVRVRLYVTTSASSGTKTFTNIQLEQGSVATDYTAFQANQVITIPCQQPMRSIGEVRDEFVKVSGTWYERHNITYIASYNGETITTDYMSTTGGLDTGASVQYVATTPTDLPCTAEQIEVLESLPNLKSYRNVTHIYSSDTTPATVNATYRKDLTTMFNRLDTLEARIELLES